MCREMAKDRFLRLHSASHTGDETKQQKEKKNYFPVPSILNSLLLHILVLTGPQRGSAQADILCFNAGV